MKHNRLAIRVAIALLVLTSAGLLATIGVVNGDGPEPHEPQSVAPEAFVAHTEPADVLPGQKPNGDEAEATPNSQPGEKTPTRVAKAAPRKKPTPTKAAVKYRPAVLQIVTNFDQADVTVNGLKYPEYYEPGKPEGMVLPAGGPYDIEVKFGDNTKNYVLYLRPEETRLLLVELSGYNSGSRPAPRPKKKAKTAKKKKKKKDDNNGQDKPGKITVYSKPSGEVIVDGKNTGEKTPGSVELENGRHEVQVEYETGSVSEKKIVRVRTGSRIKLFFRERKK